MQKGFAPILILVGILVLAAIGGAFYIGKIQSAKPATQNSVVTSSSQPTTVSQSTPTPSSDETANWKTYANTKYNFSLRYPPQWRIKEDIDNIGKFSIESPDYQYDQDNRIAEEVKIGAKISFNVLSQSNYSEPKEGEIPTQYFDTVNNKQVTAIISNISNLQIDGRNAIKYDRQRSGKNSLMEVIADIHEGTMIYQLRMMYASPSLKETFDQILSTFRFTN